MDVVASSVHIELLTLVLTTLMARAQLSWSLCGIVHCSNYTQLRRMRCRSKYDALRHGGQVRRFARVKSSLAEENPTHVSARRQKFRYYMRHKAIPVINSPWKN